MGEAALAIAAGEDNSGDREAAYRALRSRVESARAPAFWPATPGRRPLSALERTGILRLVATIPGACGEAKAIAVIEALRHAPAGDIVELGAGWGRSAALFTLLAHRWDLGPVLCVDPWSDTAAGDDAQSIFEINLAPLAGGRLNYLRTPSQEAAQRYEGGLTLKVEPFGATAYSGAISVLHLDGEPGEASRDAARWSRFVVPGGWIIWGDCAGAHGADAKRAAEAFAGERAGCIASTFQAGGACFLQLKACVRAP